MCLQRIIAAAAAFAIGFPAGNAWAEPVEGFAAYHVTLEVVRNGVLVGAPVSTTVAGQASRVELGPRAQGGSLWMQQRVSRFPGFASKALLELEFFGSGRAPGRSRIVAPTFGIELGRPESFEVKTDEGTMLIRATVEGRSDAPVEAVSGPVGIPYPEI
ncbi:MAG: hypothetical protein ACT4P0_12980 [Panacagrimonas sp.]